MAKAKISKKRKILIDKVYKMSKELKFSRNGLFRKSQNKKDNS
jgi:hypothetical protein